MMIDVTNDVYPCCRDCIQPIVVVREKLPDGDVICFMMCPVQSDCEDMKKHICELMKRGKRTE